MEKTMVQELKEMGVRNLSEKELSKKELIEKSHKICAKYIDAFTEKLNQISLARRGDLPAMLYALETLTEAVRETVANNHDLLGAYEIAVMTTGINVDNIRVPDEESIKRMLGREAE